MQTMDFIRNEIDKTTKLPENQTDPEMLPLPYPYTTPSAETGFLDMYYWDTYFTQKCLFLLDRKEQAANNVRDLAYMLMKYGKIPNGSRECFLGRSQPPFFGLMLADILHAYPEAFTMQECFDWLEKEYTFWETCRSTPVGLSRYYTESGDAECFDAIAAYKDRLNIQLENSVKCGRDALAEFESGWDCTPRFHSKCTEFAPVDLNCLLYMDEVLLSNWAEQLSYPDRAEKYAQKVQQRADQIRSCMKRDGIYFDYHYTSDTCSDVVSCAGLFPFFAGIDTDPESFRKTIAHLERPFGLVACEHDDTRYQWSAPNGWAPLHYIAVAAAHRLGLQDDARRIADKYLQITDRIFSETGRIWEKFNVETGNLEVNSEYGTPEMLGWSAGVYTAFSEFRNSGYHSLI